MIKDTKFIANITEYRNYLQQPHMEYKEPAETLYEAKLLRLFVMNYRNTGNFIHKIEGKQ